MTTVPIVDVFNNLKLSKNDSLYDCLGSISDELQFDYSEWYLCDVSINMFI